MTEGLKTGAVLSHYRLIRPLGAGGMGEVYLAEDTRLGRKVALKLLPSEFTKDADRVRRFEQEARAASALNHPNIITIHDIGQADGVHFIATEFIEGQTLRQRLMSGRMELTKALEIAQQVAAALAAAHAAGIVHRDIKPENVMLRPDGYIKVLDFGLAKLTESQPSAVDTEAPTAARVKTETGIVIGTVRYMSPEQARGQKVDQRTDIFSLGVVLYEMLTGRRPFEGATMSDVMAAILTKEPEPLAAHRSDVGPELAQAVMRCLAKEREERFQAAGELAAALKAAMQQSEQPSSSGATRREQRTFLSSRPVLIAASLAVLMIAAAIYWKLPQRGVTDAPINSLAVLPLVNMSGDPEQEYFADGMTEALISNLTQVRALRVTSRTSVMRFKRSEKSLQEIAQELKVDAVIEGSVRRAGDRVKITARLIRAANDELLWSDEYERELADVLKLQSEVARVVADKIRVQVTAEERARLASARRVNPEAQEAYLLGRHHLRNRNEVDLSLAIKHFERAIELAPDYAAAHAGLATAWAERGIWGGKGFKEVEAPARTAASRAIELDADNAEALVALSQIKSSRDWDWKGAEQGYKRALELDPSNLDAHFSYANLLMALGRHPEAISEIAIAERLDPLSSLIQSNFGRILYRARKYDEAIQHFKRAIDLDPRNQGAYGRLGDVYAQIGKYDEAIRMYEKASSLRSDVSGIHPGIAFVYALTGKQQEARQIVSRARRSALERAAVYVALGDKDEAIRVLEKAIEARDALLTFIKTDPRLESLHSHPRWKELLQRMNFPE
jgi:serine/threonine protein kinase/Tfp pilus assembly protein PilF